MRESLLGQMATRANNWIYGKTGIMPTRFHGLKSIKQLAIERDFKNHFILRTMPKSGSHYIMNILANYIAFNFFGEKKPLNLSEVPTSFWNPVYHKRQLYSPESLLRLTGFSSFKFAHILHDVDVPWYRFYLKNPKIIINTYRNPIDSIVSRFFFSKESYKPTVKMKDIVDAEMIDFIVTYKGIKELAKRDNVKNVAYENLYRNPFETTKEILIFAGIPFCGEALTKAVDASSRKNIQQYEKESKLTNLYHPKVSCSMVRSGEIGQWKNYFTEEDLKKIEVALENEGLSLSEFILE